MKAEDAGLKFPPLDSIPQEARDEVNEYLAGMAARGFVPEQKTVDEILARHKC